MTRLTSIALISLAALSLAAPLAFAQDDDAREAALEMRQGHMLQFATNLGVLGGMAKGEVEYDAAAAQVAADNLHHLAAVQWGYMWPEGTAEGEIDDSEALPAIWSDPAGFEAKHQSLMEAATAMQAAAGTDLASLQGGMEALGGSCGGCHETYRAKDD